jgi:hypothetical protein
LHKEECSLHILYIQLCKKIFYPHRRGRHQTHALSLYMTHNNFCFQSRVKFKEKKEVNSSVLSYFYGFLCRFQQTASRYFELCNINIDIDRDGSIHNLHMCQLASDIARNEKSTLITSHDVGVERKHFGARLMAIKGG